MRAKRYAFFCDLAKLVQTEDLKASGIGQNRSRPRHEAMQSTKVAHGFDSRAQVEVISVAEKNLNAEFLENVLGHGFDRRRGADGHEHRRFDLAVRREQPPSASGAGMSLDLELDGHLCLPCDCSNGTTG